MLKWFEVDSAARVESFQLRLNCEGDHELWYPRNELIIMLISVHLQFMALQHSVMSFRQGPHIDYV